MEKIGTWDIESENWIRFRLLGFYDGEIYKKFFSVSSFLDFIDRPAYKGFHFFSHNGGRFDNLFLLQEMFSRNYELRFTERQGSLLLIFVSGKYSNWIFADSYALLPLSLEKLTKAFDVKHKKKKFKFAENLKVNPHDSILQEYLENDCIGLYESLEKFYEQDFIYSEKFTIASQALDTFKNKFCNFELKRVHLGFESMLRNKFYSGGRTEVYKGYGKNITVYDVNSLYPSVMLNDMPCGKCHHTNVFNPNKIGFYRVILKNVPDFYISPLLYKADVKNIQHNYYCNGDGEYYLDSATLSFLKDNYGVKIKVLYGMVFDKKKPLFNRYVEYFYNIKATQKGKPEYLISKLFLNSLYGKFGQSRWKESIETYTGRQTNFRPYDDNYGLILVERESKSEFIMPYIASYITSLARLEHFKLLNIAPDDCYYCDTDSLFTTSNKYEKLVNKKIGSLSNEGKYKEAVFVLPKTYALRNNKEEVIAFKGFDADEFSFSDLYRHLTENLILKFTKKRILSFRECSTRINGIVEHRGKFLKLVQTEKIVRSSYDRRVKIISKKHIFDTKPFNRKDLL
jgi:DNA polymerase elongation subunit (family B)